MNARVSPSALAGLRPEAATAPKSGIGEVANYGRGRPGLVPLWVGEGDRPTPDFIVEAAHRAMRDGHTFYTWQRGEPELREAIARYVGGLYGVATDPARFTVTVGGMHALQMAVRLVAGSGDEVVAPSPTWTNFAGAVAVAGASLVEMPMQPGPSGWTLDLDRLEDAITPRTRAIIINSPGNPTGWTAARDELAGILELARRHGLWIIADEIYGRFVFDAALAIDGRPAPSFRDVMAADDRVLFVQTFSKNWSMTGWRIGWLEAPASLGPTIESLVQYSTSGVASFIQQAAIVALEHGEVLVAENVAIARRGREAAVTGLRATGLVDLPPPPGAFYAFFRIAGVTDTRDFALRLVDVANVGLAPGSAFGAGGGDYIRMCVLRDEAVLRDAIDRIVTALPGMVGAASSAA